MFEHFIDLSVTKEIFTNTSAKNTQIMPTFRPSVHEILQLAHLISFFF